MTFGAGAHSAPSGFAGGFTNGGRSSLTRMKNASWRPSGDQVSPEGTR